MYTTQHNTITYLYTINDDKFIMTKVVRFTLFSFDYDVSYKHIYITTTASSSINIGIRG